MTVATAAERQRLNDLFAELCRIPSRFGRERACADRVAAELRGLGLEVVEDDTAERSGAECGNLLARVPGTGERSILLCAHLDTVVDEAPIEPELVEGVWRNRNEGILGADNKAAVAVLLVAAAHCVASPAPVGLELLFTTSEEVGLKGASAFDISQLRSDFGYVFDHATPIGEVVISAPTIYHLTATFHGQSAHAGLRPEEGRSAILAAARAIAAMPLGRIDDATTANVGQIDGGSDSWNIVADRCQVAIEARGRDEARIGELVGELIDHCQDAANATECDVDVHVQRMIAGYRVKSTSPALAAIEEALRRCGHEPVRIESGGGADANAFQERRFECLNVANGTERNHQPDEAVSAQALEDMLDIVLTLTETAAAVE